MGLSAATGVSRNPFTTEAAQEAVSLAVEKLNTIAPNQPPKLAIVFASVQYDCPKLLSEITQRLDKQVILIGGTTAAAMTEIGSHKKALSIMLIASDSLSVQPGIGTELATNPYQAGKTAASQVIEKLSGRSPKTYLCIADGLIGDTEALAAGLNDGFQRQTQVIGGAAGDDFFFRKTYQFFGTEVLSGSVVGVGLDGTIPTAITSASGWQNVGFGQKVSHSRQRVIETINGQNALQMYREYFGDEAASTMTKENLSRLAVGYPLGYFSDIENIWQIRTPIVADGQGHILCSGSIPPGTEVELMVGGRKEAIASAQKAAEGIFNDIRRVPKAAIVFSSASRSRMYGLRVDEEISAITKGLTGQTSQPNTSPTPVIGSYGYGEILPNKNAANQRSAVFQNGQLGILGFGDNE